MALLVFPPDIVRVHGDVSWLDTWAYRRQITLDSSDIDEALTDFPILVSLSASSGIDSSDVTSIFDEVGADCNATAYTLNDGTTRLYFEVEEWNATSEEAWVWVKVPSISNISDTTIYIYYDSSKDGSAYHVSENVWDDFVLVTHMLDDPDTSHVRDSTSNNNDGTKKASNEPIEADGKIGEAQDFDGVDDYIKVLDSPSLNPDEVTLEAWVLWKSTPMAFCCFASKWDNNGYEFAPSPALHVGRWVVRDGAGTAQVIEILGSPELNRWYYHVGTFAGGKMRFYLDGVLQKEIDVTQGITKSTHPFRVGASGRATPNLFSPVIEDEGRISNIARSPAWVKASYETQRDHLLSFGTEEAYVPPSEEGGDEEGKEGGSGPPPTPPPDPFDHVKKALVASVFIAIFYVYGVREEKKPKVRKHKSTLNPRKPKPTTKPRPHKR